MLGKLLPAFQNHPAMQMRTHKENGILYGSIFDCLRWFGLDDDRHNDWHHWVKAEFQEFCILSDSRGCEILEIILPESKHPTPMTTFAGFRALVQITQRKSKISQGFADKALEVLGQVAVGDQRLHVALDANAAAAPRETRGSY